MKFIIVCILFAIVACQAAPSTNAVGVVRSDTDVQPNRFRFGVETSDGFRHDAEGQLNNEGSDHESIAVHGQYSYVGDDGVTYTVTYTADENGFQPQGAHIPVA